MPDKLTDKEIVKALECCVNGECPNCPLSHNNTGVYNERCGENLMQNALDLINRLYELYFKLQAENERLKAENDNLKNGFFQEYYKTEECQELLSVRKAWEKAQMDYIKLDTEWEGKYKTAKAEAYKECIEKVIETASVIKANAFQGCYVISKGNLDNLLKELVGEDNA